MHIIDYALKLLQITDLSNIKSFLAVTCGQLDLRKHYTGNPTLYMGRAKFFEKQLNKEDTLTDFIARYTLMAILYTIAHYKMTESPSTSSPINPVINNTASLTERILQFLPITDLYQIKHVLNYTGIDLDYSGDPLGFIGRARFFERQAEDEDKHQNIIDFLLMAILYAMAHYKVQNYLNTENTNPTNRNTNMKDYIEELLPLTDLSEIKDFLMDTCTELELNDRGSRDSALYELRAKHWEEEAQQATDADYAVKCQVMAALFTIADYKVNQQTVEDKHSEEALKKICDTGDLLATKAQETIDRKFGKNYSQKNPHVFSTVLNTFRTAYISVHENNKK